MQQITPPEPGHPYALLSADSANSITKIDEQIIIDLYKNYGAVLLRGFDVDVANFADFTGALCSSSVFNESPDRTVLDASHNIQTVNEGVHAFPLHPELSREPWKPDVCFFWCMSPPTHGGETVICDGVEIVRQMPTNVRKAFDGRDLVYTLMASPEVCRYWLGADNPNQAALDEPREGCPYRFFEHRGKIFRSFSRPALHKPMFHDERAFGNFLFFARYLLGWKDFPELDRRQYVSDALLANVKRVADRLTVPVQWNTNDVLMLDNTRFMHGRNAVTDPDVRRIASYFGYLKFAEPSLEEPPNAIWRRTVFRPPARQKTE